MKRTHRDGQAITAPELAEMAGASEQSARDTLKTMAQNGVLLAEKPHGTVRYVPEWKDYDGPLDAEMASA